MLCYFLLNKGPQPKQSHLRKDALFSLENLEQAKATAGTAYWEKRSSKANVVGHQ